MCCQVMAYFSWQKQKKLQNSTFYNLRAQNFDKVYKAKHSAYFLCIQNINSETDQIKLN